MAIQFITLTRRHMAIRPHTTRRLEHTEFRKPPTALTEDPQLEAHRTILTQGLRLTRRRLLMPMAARKLAQLTTPTQVHPPPRNKAPTDIVPGEVPQRYQRMVRAPTHNTTRRHRERRDRYRLLLVERPLARVAPTEILPARVKRQTAILYASADGNVYKNTGGG